MRFVTSAAGLVLVALVLGGCVRQPPPVVPTSTPTVAPVFATDADALAAAKTAYTGYLAASDAVGADGGRNASILSTWVSKAWFPTEAKSYLDFSKTHNVASGTTTFTDFLFERQSLTRSGDATVVAYVCLDLERVRIKDASGAIVTPTGSQNHVPLEVTFVSKSHASVLLVIDRSTPWRGADFCS
jgi:hypothetical protein